MSKSIKQLRPITIPSKNKNSNIAQLSRNLFDKIGTFQAQSSTSQEISSTEFNKQIDHHYDSLTELLTKAQKITNLNNGKIMQAKKMSKKSSILGRQNNNGGTFLTGTGLYQRQNQEICIKNPYIEQVPEGLSHTEMLKDLIKNEEQDDLAQLRRMIKQTDQNIAACHKKVAKTHKNIMNYVEESYEGSKTKKSQSSCLIKNRFR